MNLLGVLSRILATEAFPKGGRLVCRACRLERSFTCAEAATYLAQGWPMHCGISMHVERPEATEAT